MVKALIFDVDGTLAETEEAHRAAFNQTFKDWGLDWSWSRDHYAELLKTTGGKERMRRFQDDLPDTAQRLSDTEIAALHKDKTQAYASLLAQGKLTLRPGVAELFTSARSAGLRLAVATTTNTPNVQALTDCCWARDAATLFDVIAAGDMVNAKKPAPDVFQLALDMLGLPAEDCIAFEDSRNGLLSARGAGLKVVVTPSAYTKRDDFSETDWVIPDLRRESLPKCLTTSL